MPFVLDASVTIGWCLQDEAYPYARDVMSRLQHDTACVPAIWAVEVANVLIVALRRGRSTENAIHQVMAWLPRLEIMPDDRVYGGGLPAEVVRLAIAHGLTAYDASYLELAQRLAIPIAALDEKLKQAAEALGVGLV